MNNQCIIEKFAQMADLTNDEASNWADLCYECGCEIWGKKKPSVNKKQENIVLTHLAATMAFYRYCLYKASKANEESFKVGDVSVKENSSSNIKFAKLAFDAAMASAAQYLEDDGFSFEQVRS